MCTRANRQAIVVKLPDLEDFVELAHGKKVDKARGEEDTFVCVQSLSVERKAQKIRQTVCYCNGSRFCYVIG